MDTILSARTISDVPILEPGQSLIVAEDNRCLDPEFMPVSNKSDWPDWFKNRPRGEGTLGNCAGVQDVLSLGYTFRMPAAMTIAPDSTGQNWTAAWEAPWSSLNVNSFSYTQVGDGCPVTQGRALPKGSFIKIVNPWLIKTAPGWSTMLIPPFWEQRQDWTLMPGAVNTDYYHHANWVINIYTDKKFTIPRGAPIAQAITFPRNCDYSLLYGDASVGHLLTQRGFGGAFTPPPGTRRTAYRRLQKKADQACPVHVDKKPTFRQRLFSRSPNSKLV